MQKQQKGSIVNISSVAGLKGIICRSPYATSKLAMHALSKTIAN